MVCDRSSNLVSSKKEAFVIARCRIRKKETFCWITCQERSIQGELFVALFCSISLNHDFDFWFFNAIDATAQSPTRTMFNDRISNRKRAKYQRLEVTSIEFTFSENVGRATWAGEKLDCGRRFCCGIGLGSF